MSSVDGSYRANPWQSLPANPPKLRKIAVLMTDGMYNTARGWKDQDPVQMATDAKQMCSNMKAQGRDLYGRLRPRRTAFRGPFRSISMTR
jgi:hypothetical protein